MSDVKNTLVSLARLQDLETALGRVERELERVPSRIADIEKTLAASEKAVAAARQSQQDAGKDRRALEQEIEVIKTRIAKYQDQLLAVKTNDQYRALNKEIATERGKIEAIEEKILVNMEKVDELGVTLKAREAELGRERGRVAAEKQSLEAERKRAEAERAELSDAIRSLLGTIENGALAIYRRIASTRGSGLARVEGGGCSECRVRVRPQPLVEVRSYERLVQCESCQRVLYIPPEAAAAAEARFQADAQARDEVREKPEPLSEA